MSSTTAPTAEPDRLPMIEKPRSSSGRVAPDGANAVTMPVSESPLAVSLPVNSAPGDAELSDPANDSDAPTDASSRSTPTAMGRSARAPIVTSKSRSAPRGTS